MFSNITQHLDSRVGALFLAFNDLIRGGFINVTKENALPGEAPDVELGPGVNWEAYIKFHLQEAQKAMEAFRAEQAAKVQLITPDGAAEVATDAEQPTDVIFGGDQEHVEVSPGNQASATG